MKRFGLLLVMLLCFAGLSCSKDDDMPKGGDPENENPNTETSKNYNISGVVEKGPFVSGSAISVQPLGDKMQSLGIVYNAIISNNEGSFSFGSNEFASPYAELVADGYFFNEVKGELSSGVLRLRSVVNLKSGSKINVNILTHLKYPRIINLVSKGVAFDEANKQAQRELLAVFGLQKYAEKRDASQFSITSGTDEAAVLAAISILMLGDRTEAELTEYLASLSDEFGRNGKLSAESMAIIADGRDEIYPRLHEIEQNIVNRYNELGREVKVKELTPYFDWDSDGEAGNEVLADEQSVNLSQQNIEVPAEGGQYSITVSSPIPLYLEPLVGSGEPEDNVIYESVNLYSEDADVSMRRNATLEGNTLKIDVAESRSRSEMNSTLCLYDCVGNVVATVELSQKGNPTADIPQLGVDGQAVVAGIARYLSQAYGKYNIIEQCYHYNPLNLSNDIYVLSPIPLSVNNSDVEAAWSSFYMAIRNILQLKDVDKSYLNIYQPYCNVLLANIYYSMVVAWGDIPYFKDFQQMEESVSSVARTPQNTILAELEDMLLEAIDYLDEKHNTPLKDANGLFFASKDVARITLANIYMYSNRHEDAMPLIEQVIANGFYTLSEDDFGAEQNTSTFNTLFEEDELIYGVRDGSGTRANIVILLPGTIALQTITDAYLSLAECYFRAGSNTKAEELVERVATAKNIALSGDVLTKIHELRSKILLYSAGYFPYMKRAGLAEEVFDVESWQLLWPIPSSEIVFNPNITQNDGY